MDEGKRLREAMDAVSDHALDDVMGRAFRSTAATGDVLQDEFGEFVGPYKLLEQIGEGGFGVVYLAEQQAPIRRRVALKIIKLGMDTKQVVARFEAERQALALMDHENIASVFDAGATKVGRLYFVMELVRGEPITEYCDKNKLHTDERLKLFVSVCKAVQHAHQKGIIHRDLKPSNVMVAQRDNEPIPKVIDFGVAKATQLPLTEKTMHTRFGQFIGTPAYMSPEQFEMSKVDVDTRSDVYSLGVLLYELLTGTLPIEQEKLVNATYSEMQRMICEDEPPKPSSRLSQSGEALARISLHCNMAPKKLSQLLRGDLDWIVMKALEKDRSRRYETANGMAADVLRFLSNEPVEAKGRSIRYVLSKMLRRHKVAVSLAATFVIMLIAFGATMSILYQRASESQRKEAATAATLRRNLYSYYLSRAATAFESGELVAMREFLDECPGDLRHWEWAWMYARTDDSDRKLVGHTDRVWDVSYRSDGRQIASASRDGSVRLWDAISGQSLFDVAAHEGGARDVEFGPNARLIASCGEDGTVRLSDAQSGQPRRVLVPDHSGGMWAVAFNADGSRVASGGRSNIITIWKTTDGIPIKTLIGHTAPVTGVAFSHDDRWIASSSQDRTIRLWNSENGELVWTSEPVANWLHSVAFSPDSKLVASACFNGDGLVWDVASGNRVLSLWGHKGPVHSVSFSPNGERILSASLDSTMKLWDTATGREITTFTGHATGIWSAVFSPIGDRIASAGLDGVRIWDPSERMDTSTLRGHGDEVRSVAFRRDGRQVASAGFDHDVKLWDPVTGQVMKTLQGHSDRVTSVAYDPKGSFVVTASDDHSIRIWSSAGEHRHSLEGNASSVWAVAVTKDGKQVVSGSKDGLLIIWETDTGRQNKVIRAHELPIEAISISPLENLIATCGRDKTIRLWNGKTGKLHSTFEGHQDDVLTVAFSPDGTRLVSGSADHTIKLWDTSDGKLLSTLHGHAGQVRRVAFTDDGTRVFSAGADRTIRIWNPNAQELLLTLRGHEDTVYDLSISPDGATIASASADHTIKLWRANLALDDRSAR